MTCKATVKVDQEIGGQMVENEVPIRMFSMKNKKDGTTSKIYTNILQYKEDFVSLAACPEGQCDLATMVAVNNGKFDENTWVDKTSGVARSGFQISTNFISKARAGTEQGAVFELSGVILGITPEVDSNDDETGRVKVKFAIVGYAGKVEVLDLIAEAGNAATFIQSNWNDGDTVNLNGAVNINQSVKTWYEEQGFGEPIKRTKTETRKELVILGGSPSGLEEAFSYDSDDIKKGLAERQARIKVLQDRAASNKPKTKTTSFGF